MSLKPDSIRHKAWLIRTCYGALPGRVDVEGTRRRLQALAALGWTMPKLSAECDVPVPVLNDALSGVYQTCYRSTAERVTAAYEKCSAIVPSGRLAKRSRTMAAAKGWASPLAWDDIDNDPEPADLSHLERMAS